MPLPNGLSLLACSLLAGCLAGACGDSPPAAGAGTPPDPAPPPRAAAVAPDTPGTARPPADATSRTAAADSTVPVVVFLGDSISAGLHLPANEAFPAVLQRRLSDTTPFVLRNAGVSGDTTSGGLRRLSWVLRQRPAVVVIELGGNDGLRGVAVPLIEKNLRAIIAGVRDAGARVLLLGMRMPPNYGEAYAGAFHAAYVGVARDLDVPLVPFFMEGVAGDPAMNLADGLHPTAAGHERLADNVAPSLRALLTPPD